MKNIILTGFMGTGKTTVGKLLAKQLDYDFIDTDALIEAQAGCSIPTIFQQQGETAFRQMERNAAHALSQREGLVISTGGGMMLNSINVTALSQTGHIFCLVATPEEILSRLQQDTAHPRPLLDVPNPSKRLVEILEQRKAGYGRFPQILTTGKSPDDVASDLLALIRPV